MEEGDVVYLLVHVHTLFEDEQILMASLSEERLLEEQKRLSRMTYVSELRIVEVPLI